jgi:SAM-dependent methyltransferase
VIGALYEDSLARRADVVVEFADGATRPLPVDRWRVLHATDEPLLRRCVGPVLDVGCGPGRLVTELAARGQLALGIDVTPTAVAMTARSGGSVLRRDVFARVPAPGRWRTVLLADGNVGIGGDPVALLDRVYALLAPGGQVVADVDPPGRGLRRTRVRLRTATATGHWFPWASVGADELPRIAARAGFAVTELGTEAGRWLATLRRR